MNMKIHLALLLAAASTFEARAQGWLGFSNPGGGAVMGHGYNHGLISIPVWRPQSSGTTGHIPGGLVLHRESLRFSSRADARTAVPSRQDLCMECRYLFPSRLDELSIGRPQLDLGRAQLRGEFTPPGGRRNRKLEPFYRRIGRLGSAVLQYR